MPWPIRYHEKRPEKVQPGDMWPRPLPPEERRNDLAPYYWENNAGKRLPLVIRLPGGAGNFCIDGVYEGETWEVTGDSPNITVSPSIDAPGLYHGFLTNGVLSDDVDGRTF